MLPISNIDDPKRTSIRVQAWQYSFPVKRSFAIITQYASFGMVKPYPSD